MRFLIGFALASLTVVGFAESASGALIVNAAQPITKHVQVQLIQTALDNGATPATVFGNAAQQATIDAEIDTVWAQAGIAIDFLPTITRYNSTFAYQGNAGTGTRPQGDLNTIVANARVAGVLNPDPQVIDMFLVNVVPAFAPLNESYAAGLSFIGGNGVVGFTGDNLLTFGAGLDVIAGVFAHEIGHNLGLPHVVSTGNLMTASTTTQQLDASQIATARASTFARALATPIAGDYGGNGIVDAADYVKWRNTLNQTGAGLAADGNANGVVDAGDFTVWRSHFGEIAGGAGSSLIDGTVPEPSATVYLFGLLFLTARRSRK